MVPPAPIGITICDVMFVSKLTDAESCMAATTLVFAVPLTMILQARMPLALPPQSTPHEILYFPEVCTVRWLGEPEFHMPSVSYPLAFHTTMVSVESLINWLALRNTSTTGLELTPLAAVFPVVSWHSVSMFVDRLFNAAWCTTVPSVNVDSADIDGIQPPPIPHTSTGRSSVDGHCGGAEHPVGGVPEHPCLC